jgi:hypothetical protein
MYSNGKTCLHLIFAAQTGMSHGSEVVDLDLLPRGSTIAEVLQFIVKLSHSSRSPTFHFYQIPFICCCVANSISNVDVIVAD